MASNLAGTVANEVKDLTLAESGKRRIEWAFQSMPVLQSVRKQFIKDQPLAGIHLAACVPLSAETANLFVALRDGGATLSLCGAGPLSTQDDVAASLVRDYGLSVFAFRGEDEAAARQHLQMAIETQPKLTLNSGGDLTTALHDSRPELVAGVLGGTEESPAGVARLKGLVRQGRLGYPVVATSDAPLQHLLDNRYGVGQSAVDAIVRATNVLIAGMTVVIAGYGRSGRGIALRARGLGAHVVVCEVDPARAIEAVMDGHRVLSMTDAAQAGDILITATGNKNVISRDHFDKLKNGAILCNAGHSVEIDLESLARLSSSHRPLRESVEEYAMRDGRRLYLLSGGRAIHLAGDGLPATVMDLCLATQALCVEYLLRCHAAMEKRLYPVPEELDRRVAKMKLEAMGIKIDRLTPEQETYLAAL